MSRDKQPQCRFVMTGFSQTGESRSFTFDRIEADHSRTKFTVRADLILIRLYGIHIQELPLMCCEMLERSPDLDTSSELTFGEDLMRQHKAIRMAAAEKKFKAPKRVPPGNTANSWGTASRRS